MKNIGQLARDYTSFGGVDIREVVMGYSTNFIGSFRLSRKLSAAEYLYLTKFSETRRVKRKSIVVEFMSDPWREAVGLPVGIEGGYFVNADGFRGQGGDDSISNYNSPPSGQPSLWCQWIPSEERSEIIWDGGEKFYSYVEWLAYIQIHFLERWGIGLSGIVKFYGEDSRDRGFIVAKDGMISLVKKTVSEYMDSPDSEQWILDEMIFNIEQARLTVQSPSGERQH